MDKIIEIVRNWGKALKVSDFAKIMNMSRKAVYTLISDGKIAVFRIGDSIRLDPVTTAEWLRSRWG
jgi:excisionase family DNA binding protein